MDLKYIRPSWTCGQWYTTIIYPFDKKLITKPLYYLDKIVTKSVSYRLQSTSKAEAKPTSPEEEESSEEDEPPLNADDKGRCLLSELLDSMF
jgi:hypothetical protein